MRAGDTTIQWFTLVGEVMSMNAKHSVRIVLSVSAALILCGCDNATENNVTVTPATHQTAGPNAAAAIASTAMSAADDTKPAAQPAAKPEGKQAPNPQASPGSVNLSDREDQPRMIPLAPPSHRSHQPTKVGNQLQLDDQPRETRQTAPPLRLQQ
jgi:hypothetical protein